MLSYEGLKQLVEDLGMDHHNDHDHDHHDDDHDHNHDHHHNNDHDHDHRDHDHGRDDDSSEARSIDIDKKVHLKRVFFLNVFSLHRFCVVFQLSTFKLRVEPKHC
jgi:hypothetical protein